MWSLSIAGQAQWRAAYREARAALRAGYRKEVTRRMDEIDDHDLVIEFVDRLASDLQEERARPRSAGSAAPSPAGR